MLQCNIGLPEGDVKGSGGSGDASGDASGDPSGDPSGDSQGGGPRSMHMVAAIDAEFGPGDVGGVLGGEKPDHGADFRFRHTQPGLADGGVPGSGTCCY